MLKDKWEYKSDCKNHKGEFAEKVFCQSQLLVECEKNEAEVVVRKIHHYSNHDSWDDYNFMPMQKNDQMFGRGAGDRSYKFHKLKLPQEVFTNLKLDELYPEIEIHPIWARSSVYIQFSYIISEDDRQKVIADGNGYLL